jgi:hypothetical protein
MKKDDAAARSVQLYRARMRQSGLRLVQLWVPDTRAPGFAEECRRQSRVAARHRRVEGEITNWIDETPDTSGWTG